jgi:uncharacterized ion transporter superfamily protein YfcC
MKKIKMPSAYTILLFIIIIVAILTWIVPAGQYQYIDPSASKLQPIPGTYTRAIQNPQGLWEIISAPIKGFYDAKDIALFILVIGGFLAVVMKTGAIDAGIGHAVKRLEGREYIMLPILMIIFGIGGTTFGMAEETIAFYPLMIPVLIAAGYDAVTALSVIALGAGIGVIGSTVNPFATGVASGFAGISIGEGLLLRLLFLVIGEVIGIIYVMSYARKVKEDPSKSLLYHMKEENEKHFLGNRKEESSKLTIRKIAVLWVFGLTFLVMVLGVIPWASKFGITFFESLNTAIQSIPVMGRFIGKPVPLGDWWFGEITVLFLVSSIIIAVIYKLNEIEFINTFIEGARDLLSVALIIGLSRGITIVMNEGGMTATILHMGEVALRNVGSVAFTNLAYLFYIPMSFFVPSSSGLATLTMPIMAPLADFANVSRDIVVTAYQAASGIVNLVTPTSGVVMGALAISRVPYAVYFKFIWKLLIILSVMIMAFISVATVL